MGNFPLIGIVYQAVEGREAPNLNRTKLVLFITKQGVG